MSTGKQGEIHITAIYHIVTPLMDKNAQYTTPEEDLMIDNAFREVLNAYMASNHRKKVEIIERAYQFAKQAHHGIRRRSGEPYILHPIAVAKIALEEMGLGSTSICAALLHDVVEDTEFTIEDVRHHFGEKIAMLVEGLTKISGGIFGDKASVQAENFRKLLLTMAEDIRVVLLKMADRLHNMRTLGSMAPNKQFKIAGETLYIYAPLAHRLGLFAIKTELEDLAFKFEHPHAHAQIAEQIALTEKGRQMVYTDFSTPILQKLDEMGIKYEAKARVKSCYSIWRKMETKHIPFNEVYDLYAMRIVFECADPAMEKQMCWNIYSVITDIYKLHPERTRDWLSAPKANGYKALHLTVMGPDGNWIEVQIRSKKMDEIAEKGLAAHWKYKIGEGEEESEIEAWLHTIKDMLKDPTPNALDFLDTIKLDLYSREIIVFTPSGETITLPAKATVLDLAFTLHSDLGSHCIAGKVNHKLVPLSTNLKSGDQVEVLTSQQQEPQREWFEYLTTAKAKTRLRHALLKTRQPLVAKGKEMLDRFLKENEIDNNNLTYTKLLGLFHVNNLDELCYELGAEEKVLNDYVAKSLKKAKERFDIRKASGFIKKVLHIRKGSKKGAKEPEQHQPVNMKETYILKSEDGVANYKIAECCSPIPGDEVMGFVDDNNEVIVHALNCPHAMRLKASYGPRIVTTKWESENERFLAHIHIEGIDRHGILQSLTNMISMQLNMDIRELNIKATNEVFGCELWVKVSDTKVVTDLINKIKKIDGVKSAVRIQDISHNAKTQE